MEEIWKHVPFQEMNDTAERLGQMRPSGRSQTLAKLLQAAKLMEEGRPGGLSGWISLLMADGRGEGPDE